MGCGASAPAEPPPAPAPKPKASPPPPAAAKAPAAKERAAEAVPAPAAPPKADPEPAAEAPPPPAKEEIESTLAMIKPDAVSAGAASMIKQAIVHKGFEIVRERCYKLSVEQAGHFYAEHEGKPFYDTLVNFMTSGEIYALELRKEGAIKAWRAMMGPTSSDKAKAEAPESLRAQFGTDGTKNATHGSDSPESAAREIAFHFPEGWDKEAPEVTPEAVDAPVAADMTSAGAEDSVEEEQKARSYKLGDEDEEAPKEATPDAAPAEASGEEEIDIGDGEEEQQAAVKLQATFRGYQARKEMKAKRAEDAPGKEPIEAVQEEGPAEEAAEEVEAPASELEEVPAAEVTPALDSPMAAEDAPQEAEENVAEIAEDAIDAPANDGEEGEQAEEAGATVMVDEAVDDILDKAEDGDTVHGGVAAESG